MLLEHILVHPDTHDPLRVDWSKKNISMDSNDKYQTGFVENVLYILPSEPGKLHSSDIHQGHHTDFDYLDHYQRDAEVFDYFTTMPGKADQEERRRLDQMIIRSIPENASSILDVGCGNGWLAKAMTDEKTSVISMDISSRNPVEALRRHPHPRHEAIIADVFHLPFRENSLDCIVASEIMEHVPDPGLFIQKLLFVLRPGGKLIVTTPYNEQIQYHLCVHCNRPTPSHAHLHSFNEENIPKLIPQGIQDWKIRTFSHKYMIKSRVYLLMKYFPFSVWQTADTLANRTWNRPMRLMLELVK